MYPEIEPTSLSHREKWITDLVAGINKDLLPDSAATADLWNPDVDISDLTRSTLATHVAELDQLATSAEEITNRLQATPLFRTGDLYRLHRELVWPVVQRVRTFGAPWRKWWDVSGLSCLLLELWASQRPIANPQLQRIELTSYWGLQNPEVINTLLELPTDPFVHLPSELIVDTEFAQSTRQMVGRLLKIQDLDAAFTKWRSKRPAELGTRPDLLVAARRLVGAKCLAHALKQLITDDLDTEAVRQAGRDLDGWFDRFRQFFRGLTSYETDLLAPLSPDDEYSGRCLDAGHRILHFPLLLPDSLPSRATSRDDPYLPPEWIEDLVLANGARMWHGHVGPYPVWFMTADSGHERVVESLLDSDRTATELVPGDDVFRLNLTVAMEDDPARPLRIPFSYDLRYPAEAWELLLLAMAGHCRLIILELTREGDLVTIGSLPHTLPRATTQPLQDAALRALRRDIGNDMDALRAQLFHVDSHEMAVAGFIATDRAKSEEINEELVLGFREDLNNEEERLLETGRALARLHAQRVSLLVDDREESTLTAAIDEATQNRRAALDLARRPREEEPADPGRELDGLSAHLPDETTAFIHFTVTSGYLSAFWCRRRGGEFETGFVDLSHVSIGQLTLETEAWVSSSSNLNPYLGRARQLERVRMILGPIIRSVLDEADDGNLKRLLISPTTPLDVLPLHGAPLGPGVDSPILLEKYQVIYMPSLRVLASISPSESLSDDRALLIAHSGSGVPGMSVLHGPAREAEAFRHLYPKARVMQGAEADVDSVLKAFAGARIIHISSHGHASLDRYESGLVLAGDSYGRALLSAARVLADGDFRTAEIVVLAACESGLHPGTTRRVQTLRGLDGAFLTRGARVVLSTLCEVPDTASLVMSVLFHGALLKASTPASSYQMAIGYLRGKLWHLPSDEYFDAEDLLDRVAPHWRDRLENERKTFGSTIWAPFKLSGAAWHPISGSDI